jgi:hypothetical protein
MKQSGMRGDKRKIRQVLAGFLPEGSKNRDKTEQAE